MATNMDKESLKAFTDRIAGMLIEKKERDDEHREDLKEIKLEIKGKFEETGVDADLVMFCAKARMAELEVRMKLMTDTSYMELYNETYGVNVDVNKVAEEEAPSVPSEDDDALG
jgi:hypothetical protein